MQRTEGHFDGFLRVEMDRWEFLIQIISNVACGLSEADRAYNVRDFIQALFILNDELCNA